jgi:gamma-glutamyltranspeptidase/glutathione hydrolase
MDRTRLPVLLLALLLCGPAAALDPAPEAASGWTGRTAVTGERAMVVTANAAASEAAIAVLDAGGTAADALVSAQAVLNLVEPQSSGVGGGALLLYWDASTRRLTTLDGRETAPASARADRFLATDGAPLSFEKAVPGGLSVGVPGTVRLLAAAHGRFGRRPWGELWAPAIRMAEDGFAISPRLAGAIAANAESIRAFPATAAYFLDAAGAAKPEGAILRNPALAETFRRIATGGADAFYRGPVAAAIAAAVAAAPVNPATLTEADLAGYAVRERPPVCVAYRVWRVCGMGPPSSGGVAVGQILGILSHFDMAAMGPRADGIHVLLEASRLAFADRDRYLADSDHVRVPVAGLLEPGYLTARAQLVDLDRSVGQARPGNPRWDPPEPRGDDRSDGPPGTSHLVVVDAEGSVASLTTTIEAGFGSRILVGGFLLNNELTDFSFRPVIDGRPVANRVAAGKRPRSSMAPTIVFDRDGDPAIALGSPGGSRIIGYVAQTLVAMLDWGMSAQDAVAMGHVINRNGPTELEVGTSVAALAAALQARGHDVRLGEQNSGLHVVDLRGGRLTAGVDPRREGLAIGR